MRQFVGRQPCTRVCETDPNAIRRHQSAGHLHLALGLVVFDRIRQEIDHNLLEPCLIRPNKAGLIKLGKSQNDASFLGLRLHHGVAFGQDFWQVHRLQRQRHFAGLDHGKVQDFVDQLQEVPTRLQYLGDAFLLRIRGRWRCRGHQLRKPQNGIEWRAQFVAHAGQKVGLRQIGLLCGGFGTLHLHIGFLQSLLKAFAFRDITRSRKHALQGAVTVVEGGGVVGHHRFLAIPRTGREFVISDFLVTQHQLDARLGPRRIGEITLERRADQLITGAARERFHLLVDVGDDACRIGGHQSVNVRLDQRAGVKLLITQTLVELFLIRLHLFAGGVVGADQQIPNDDFVDVTQRGH